MSIPYDHNLAETAGFPVTQEGETDPVWPTYEKFVCNLVKERGETSKNLEHMVIGICGEAGEIADGIKKSSIYGKPLDRANIIEELGDLEFYMAGLRQMLGISRYETLAGNVSKLSARYKNGYSDAAAIERADKVEPVLQVIDMSKQQVANFVKEFPEAAPTKKEVEGADSMAASLETPGLQTVIDEDLPDIQDWCLPLLASYHAGKTVAAIAYSKNTATVLFVGDPQPYKLYRPKGEV